MDEDEEYWPDPIESECGDCGEWYTDYGCELCGYHGHECEEVLT